MAKKEVLICERCNSVIDNGIQIMGNVIVTRNGVNDGGIVGNNFPKPKKMERRYGDAEYEVEDVQAICIDDIKSSDYHISCFIEYLQETEMNKQINSKS